MATLIATIDSKGAVIASKEFERAVKRMGGGAERAARGVGKLDKASRRAGLSIKRLLVAFVGFQTVSRLTRDALAFERAMAEVGTIAKFTAQEMAALKDAMFDLAIAQGQNEAIVARGLYQAISAGATTAGEAMETLAVASKLATAGSAELGDAVTVLARTTNSYAESNLTAAEAADVLFTIVERGITTVPELAKTIGRAASFASNAGVSFQEFAAALAITTKTLESAEAITALRQLFVGLAAPTGRAQTRLQEVGQELNRSRVEADGLVGTLTQLRAAFGENETGFRLAVGGVEAMTAAMAITSAGVEEFNAELANMTDASGSVGRAFDEFMSNPGIRVESVFNAMRSAGVRMVDTLVRDLVDFSKEVGLADNATALFASIVFELEPLLRGLAATAGVSALAFKVHRLAMDNLTLTIAKSIFFWKNLGMSLDDMNEAFADQDAALDKLKDETLALSKVVLGLVESIFAEGDSMERSRKFLDDMIAARRRFIESLNEEDVGLTSVSASLERQTVKFQAANSLANEFSAAVGNVATGFSSFEEAGRRAILGVIDTITQAIAKAFILRKLLAPVFGPAFGGQDEFLKLFGLAQGGVVGNGPTVTPAASGIITGPTILPGALGAGRSVLAGEAGPELIAPVTRLPSGEVGIKTTGMGGATFNITNVFPRSSSVQESSKDVNRSLRQMEFDLRSMAGRV